MKKIKINLNRKQIILLLVNVIFVVAFLLLTFCAKNAVKDLYSQQEADRWETKKNPYAQVSAFISPERGMQEDGISEIRGALWETLSKESFGDTESNARIWIDAYSGECETVVRKDTNILSVTAVGVGGDFFQFHPLPLLSGNYISESDINHDRIVMDEGLAWALFGSNDIVGMQVWIGENIYKVAGVVRTEEGKLNETAYGNGNRMYMCFDELKKREDSLKVTCYEATVPNPISNYAYYALRDACGLPEEAAALSDEKVNPLNFEDIEVIENSNRYEFMPLYNKIKNLELQSMRTNSIFYPYWENVARAIEIQQIYYLIGRLIVLIFPAFSLIWLIHRLWKRRKWRMKDSMHHLFEKLQNKVEERRERKAKAKDFVEEGSETEVENEEHLENEAVEDENEELSEVEEKENADTEEFEIEAFE